MPTIQIQQDVNQLRFIGPLLQVGMAKPIAASGKKANEIVTLAVGAGGQIVPALIDTGASGCCIAPRLAQAMGLSPVGYTHIGSASEAKREARQFAACLILPWGSPAQSIRPSWPFVELLHDPPGFGAIIGRDVLMSMHLSLSLGTGCIVISY